MDRKPITDTEMNTLTDQELLARFFAEARTPIKDDGFSSRVMQQIEVSTVNSPSFSLTRWNFWINALGIVAGVGLLIYIGFLGRVWQLLHTVVYRIIAGIVSFDPDDLLVRVMLFLHRLPDMMPSTMQLTSLGLTIFVLLFLGANRLVQIEEKGRM